MASDGGKWAASRFSSISPNLIASGGQMQTLNQLNIDNARARAQSDNPMCASID
jgi:hypothetical protein